MGSGKRLGGKQFNFTLDFEEIYGTPKIKTSIKLEHMKALYNSNSSLTRSGTIDGVSDLTKGNCSYLGKSSDSVTK